MASTERQWNISVPTVRDIEAPLGGTSTVYEIVLIEGEEHFTYTKTFREIEDFAKKLQKKFAAEKFPALPSNSDVEVKRQASQALLEFIAQRPHIVSSSITQQFIGQDKSVKHIVKDSSSKPTLPVAPLTAAPDLFDDLFQESRFSSSTNKSNLFDDDTCDLFSSKSEEKAKVSESSPLEKPPEDKPDGAKMLESDDEEDNNLFLPRKTSLLKSEDIFDDTEDLFRVDDNLNDLLQTVSARTEAKAKGQVSSSSNLVATTKSPDDSQACPAENQPQLSLAKPLPPNKPSRRPIPTLPQQHVVIPTRPEVQPNSTETEVEPEPTVSEVEPKPAETEVKPKPTRTELLPKSTQPEVKPKPTQPEVQPKPTQPSVQPKPTPPSVQPKPTPPPSVQPKPTPSSVQPKPALQKPMLPAKPALPAKPVPKPKPIKLQTKTQQSEPVEKPTDPELNPSDIGSYIAAAEKETLRQVSLFDD